ncbi:MAG: response regulator [Cyanobacteria bacterium CRU_2_1]|nr:response regulator [Cyanobacteria bacterium CRU_2_1]
MSIPDVDPFQNAEAIADAQLQQELRSLFAVDTRNYLQRYSQIAQRLRSVSWTSDIQELYRCVHTIKGGAVTVAAEAVLQVATSLEDLLSDLRYLETAPSLADGDLSQTLLEAGELLTGTLEFSGSEKLIEAQIEPILNRIQVLHHQVREQYLPTWSEQQQLHREFAEQGFDLVVLDLEIALERSPLKGAVSETTLNIAQQSLTQLQQIGKELQFASGWTTLLEQAQFLFAQPENSIWRSQWLQFFQALKECAKQGGNLIPFDTPFDTPFDIPLNSEQVDLWNTLDQSNITTTLDIEPVSLDFEPNLQSIEASLQLDQSEFLNEPNLTTDFTEIGTFLDELSSIDNEIFEARENNDINSFYLINEPINLIEVTDLTEVNEFIDESNHDETLTQTFQPASTRGSTSQSQREQLSDAPEKVQIPIPLEKLDQSAQHLVETLLAARMTQGLHQILQNQISQLVALAQESTQYIANLRQIQDDYALLDNLRRSTSGATPERYRQGYTTINRLLETSLRLSELGAEAEKTAQQTTASFQSLDSTLLKLQNTVEDSRLIPFQNLGFRAKAILRDLMTRFGKPAQLIVQGESIELDVGTARSLEPALLHLIRNAYDHGLESPSERITQGKPEQGTICVSLQRRGNTFQLFVQDDGHGIAADAIQSRAETLGLPLISTQTPSDLLAVLCQPGFSSQTQINEISGRGVGMDIVMAQIDRLDGKLSLDTILGKGTTFSLQFPVPHLLVSCILLQAGNRIFALPTEEIKTTALFESLNPTLVEGLPSSLWTVEDSTGSSPALDLLGYWQPRSTQRSLPDTAVCVCVAPQNASQSVWLVADELLGQSDLLINPLPTPLIAPEGLMGVSLQVNGSLIPVLEAAAIAKRFLTFPTQLSEPESIEPAPPNVPEVDDSMPAILIVDDAALMRRRIEASLTAYGHFTHTCADGLEAWNWIQKHPRSTLIITDIEMPNMDGFTLIDRCRQAGITIPILVVSSRLSEEWFSEAKRLGATDYLTKGFSTVELLSKVNALLGSAT